MIRVVRLSLALLTVAFITSACATSIRDVQANPSKYRNQDVTVSGVVSESFSLLNRGVYRVTDKSGNLWVVSEKGVPTKGADVKVKGSIRQGFDLGSFGERLKLPGDLANALVLIESSHTVK